VKDVAGTLRRIDEQITAHTQSINRSRLEIARLQETRIVLMGLAEEDILVAEQARQERLSGGSNGHSVPKLIVRPEGWGDLVNGDDEGSASKAIKEGTLNKSGNLRGMVGPATRAKRSHHKKPQGHPKTGGKHRLHWDEIQTLLKTNPKSQFDIEAILQRLGLPDYHGKQRQPIYQALYEMRKQGLIQRPSSGVYQIAATQ
jgi:hypothetical protein